MGLDQYLYARKYISGSDYKKVGGELIKTTNPEYDNLIATLGLSPSELDDDYPSITPAVKVGYWRKCNQIHKWFVDNVQDGEDDCKEYYVSADKLTELHNLCKEVLDDHSKAKKLLPAHEGFFFGTYEYDEWYFWGLERTVQILERLLSNPKFLNWDFYYDSSW